MTDNTEQVTFAKMLEVASEPSDDGDMVITVKGLDTLYDILNHFSEGGTVDNYPFTDAISDANHVRGFLAVTWLSMRNFIYRQEANNG